MAAGTLSTDFTYGEVDLPGFLVICDHIAQLKTSDGSPFVPRTFVDLGCGLAKSLLVAGMYFPTLLHATGIDFNPKLQVSAESILSCHWNRVASAGRPVDASISWEFKCEDVTLPSCTWTGADLVFTYWNAMGEGIRRKIATRAREMRPGSVVITTRHSLQACSDATCCAGCAAGLPDSCANWSIAVTDWIDFERLPHETVFIHLRK